MSIEAIERLQLGTGVVVDDRLALEVERESRILQTTNARSTCSRRERGVAELRRLLIRKGEPATGRRRHRAARAAGLLDDANFARQFTRSKAARRRPGSEAPIAAGAGKTRRRARSLGRGDRRRCSTKKASTKTASIERVARKKLRMLTKVDARRESGGSFRFLARRGYDSDDIQRVLRMVLDDTGDDVRVACELLSYRCAVRHDAPRARDSRLSVCGDRPGDVQRRSLDILPSMLASEIRSRFLQYFARNGHVVRPSSSLVPADDPTLLFTNAGMVQFKKVFLGMEDPPEGSVAPRRRRNACAPAASTTTSSRSGTRPGINTFFEMLGNFSFGDYFKRDAIRFAWEFVTDRAEARSQVPARHRAPHRRRSARPLARDRRTPRLADLRARRQGQLLADGRHRPVRTVLGDLRRPGARRARTGDFPTARRGEWTELDREEFSLDAFVEGSEAGRFLEFWNLVFMQYDKQPDGTLVPLPKPSVDTGAGLERIAAITQGVTIIYHADLFAPLIAAVEQVVGIDVLGTRERRAAHRRDDSRREGRFDVVPNAVDPASFRVLADHARAVAFLLADGVFPSNEGRGYVLRRILRRAVRHAWLLGRKEPTLVAVVAGGDRIDGRRVSRAAPARAAHRRNTTRVEEQGFLATIEGGLARFEQLAPDADRPTAAPRFAARSAAKTRSVSTTRSASRSTSRS